MNDRGEQVMGVALFDGDGHAGITMTLYKAGETAERVLAATEFLYITDIDLVTEVGGDIYVDCDSAGNGAHSLFDIIVAGTFDAKGGLSRRYATPHQCPRGKKPVLFGISTGLDSLVIHGFICQA